MIAVLDAGADDLERIDDVYEVRGAPDSLAALQKAVEDAGLESTSSELSYVPNEPLAVDEEAGRKVANLLEALEENEDVQNVYTNADFPEGFEA